MFTVTATDAITAEFNAMNQINALEGEMRSYSSTEVHAAAVALDAAVSAAKASGFAAAADVYGRSARAMYGYARTNGIRWARTAR